MATQTTETAAGACVDAGGSALGMPQLCADWMGNQVAWLVVSLIVIYLLLSRVALPRIGAVLAERSGTITNDIAAAEELKQKAVEAEAAYEKALLTPAYRPLQLSQTPKQKFRLIWMSSLQKQTPKSPPKHPRAKRQLPKFVTVL